jgi:hypothetical protein
MTHHSSSPHAVPIHRSLSSPATVIAKHHDAMTSITTRCVTQSAFCDPSLAQVNRNEAYRTPMARVVVRSKHHPSGEGSRPNSPLRPKLDSPGPNLPEAWSGHECCGEPSNGSLAKCPKSD